MGIFQREFWSMAPQDFDERWDMFQRREERALERAAWMVHHLLSAWCKTVPTVDELLGRVTKG